MPPLEDSGATQAFDAALRGDHLAALGQLGDPGLDPGWTLAIRSVLPDAAGQQPPTLGEARKARAARASAAGLIQATIQCARLAFARHDVETLLGWLAELQEHHPTSPALPLLDAQIRWLDGQKVVDSELALAEAAAARADMAATVVEVDTMRSLIADSRDEARHHARRAVRMSRTEELPLQQYLAGIALARARRFDGHAHMALRILGALRGVAPRAFTSWLEHELRMAGDSASWHDGEEGRLEQARRLTADAPSAALRRELNTLVALLDPTCLEPLADEWRAGRALETPFGLAAAQTSPNQHQALSLFDPGSAVRVLASAPLASKYELLCSARPGRLETTLSVLGLAARPLSTKDFFTEVYGFPFEAPLHRGALEVVVHRIREMVGDRASIHRDLGTLSMEVHRPFAVPDPRVQRSVDESVLRALAQHPDATARESAEELGVPLRSVQHALKRLVQDGVCEANKRGRVICYRIEDTTFTEPTRVLEWRNV